MDKHQLESKAKCLELVSKELNHFGAIADLFRQIGGHSSRFVLFSLFEDFSLINDKKCITISIFFLKNNNQKKLFLFHKSQTFGINMQNVRQVI